MSHALEWKEEYSVGVKELDDQHKHYLKLLFDLFTAINKQRTREELGGIFNELIKFADFHFSTEERYFKAFNYEFKDAHIAEHRKFTKKVTDLQKQHLNNEIKISFELIDFLEDWLIQHLADNDQKYVECFTSHGLK